MIYPRPLNPGDTIAIISPSTTVNPDYIDRAVSRLQKFGFNTLVMPHAKGPASGTFASSLENRLSDFIDAYSNTEVRAILCARGGYGANALLQGISPELLLKDPKWIIGFSDISALHAMMHRYGIASIHSSMCKHLAEQPDTHFPMNTLIDILKGKDVIKYDVVTGRLSRTGVAEGRIKGGNLAVLSGLLATPYDMLSADSSENTILFIEDIAEPVYKVERMLWQMYYSGSLQNIKGLILGQFTEYKPDKNFVSIEDMADSLFRLTKLSGIPMAFDFPIGHTDYNLPIVEGAMCRLSVLPHCTSLTMNVCN